MEHIAELFARVSLGVAAIAHALDVSDPEPRAVTRARAARDGGTCRADQGPG
jgi:hypothetical protein